MSAGTLHATLAAVPIAVPIAVLSAVLAGGILARPAPCATAVRGPQVRLGPQVAYADWSRHANLEPDLLFGLGIGLWPDHRLGLEARFALGQTDTRAGGRRWEQPGQPAVAQDLQLYGAALVLQPVRVGPAAPFLLAGWQEARLDRNERWPEETFEGGPELGAGLQVQVLSRVDLRAEVRHGLWRHHASPPAPDPPGEDWTGQTLVSLGAEVTLGGRSRAAVPPDADRDGVADARDRCPNTPAGTRVDGSGCPLDADGDRVADGLDRCAGTPAGALVDTSGCPSDPDGDGVWTGLDACEGTPSGWPVDSRGCPLDFDADGVADGIDQCPETPPGARVDARGCPIVISAREVELLDSGLITVHNIRFALGRWEIPPEARPALDEIGAILAQWPELRIEIGGHTDSLGPELYNEEISRRRAVAVRDYLLAAFPGTRPEQFTAVGYGESRPLANEPGPEAMSRNRRVEFRVLNTEALQRDRERLKLLRK